MGQIIKVHPLFLVFSLLLVFLNQALLLLNYLVALILHELSHALTAKKLGYQISNINLLPFGICLNMKDSVLNPKDEILIAISGPALNLVLIIICFALWWCLPITYYYTYLFCFANFAIFSFNLLPLFPLDGGRVLLASLSQKFKRKTAAKICFILNIVFSVLFFAMFIISIFFKLNLTFLLCSLFCLSGNYTKSPNYKFLNLPYKKQGKNFYKLNNIVVSWQTPIYKLFTHLNAYSIAHFFVLDEGNKIDFSFYEDELLKISSDHPPTQTIMQAKNVLKCNKATF